MVALMLGLIACILLFGPVGLGVFAGIMIYILPIYFFFYIIRMIVDYGKKHQRKDKVVIETQRGKAIVLYKDGKWMPDSRKPKSF